MELYKLVSLNAVDCVLFLISTACSVCNFSSSACTETSKAMDLNRDSKVQLQDETATEKTKLCKVKMKFLVYDFQPMNIHKQCKQLTKLQKIQE